MPLIRDTINPLNEREVSDEEALDLERWKVVLTGTRAKTPDGLRAAAIRQVTEQLEGTTTAADAPAVVIGVGDSGDTDDDPVDDEDQTDVDDTQDPGAAPVSTTDDTRNDSQES